MNRTTRISALVCLLMMLCAAPVWAFTITVDGKLDEWGVTPGPYGSSQWTPSVGGIYFREEDQIDNYLDPGFGGQLFDAEAIYATFDSTNLYYAIVTGHPDTGANTWKPGDIALKPNGSGYLYGIAATAHDGLTQGALYSVATWGRGLDNWNGTPRGFISEPTAIEAINGTTALATGSLAYNNNEYGTAEKGSHYVIEGYIPRTGFGQDQDKHFLLHWTQTCGNDAIELTVSPTPEPASLLLFGLGVCGLFGLKFKKKGGEKI